MTNEYKLWRDMTPEEKGALLLAKHEGKRIQCFTKANGSTYTNRLGLVG